MLANRDFSNSSNELAADPQMHLHHASNIFQREDLPISLTGHVSVTACCSR